MTMSVSFPSCMSYFENFILGAFASFDELLDRLNVSRVLCCETQSPYISQPRCISVAFNAMRMQHLRPEVQGHAFVARALLCL